MTKRSRMDTIAQRIQHFHQHLPPQVELVAVSKFHPSEELQEAYDAGQRIFGESQVQELVAKQAILPQDIAWHFIGHLQTNKVKYIAPFVSLIHAIDSERLLAEVSKQALRCGRTIDCLVQVHVAQESTKYGFRPQECLEFFERQAHRREGVRIVGLMCMASFVEDQAQIAQEFATAETLFEEIKQKYFAMADYFRVKSWGMSDDHPIAIVHGSTMVRIGTTIFGERQY